MDQQKNGANFELEQDLLDQDLIKRFNERDPMAFNEIYNKYWNLLFRHAYKKIGDTKAAEDVVQELFTAILEKMGKFRPKGSLSSYLYKSIRNRVIVIMNRNRLMEKYAIRLRVINTVECTTDDIVRENELKRQIESEIRNLPPKMRTVFELSRKAHMSHQEIARELGMAEETVKRQISYAKKILRSRLFCILFSFITPVILWLNKILD